MREPFASLRRAQVVLLTRCDQASPEVISGLRDRVLKHNPQVTIAHAAHRPAYVDVHASAPVSLEALRGKRVLAFCAIGSPHSFYATLTSLGVTIVAERSWPDHHAYSADDVQQLLAWSAQHSDVDWVLCTRKDWVKLQMAKIGRVPLGAIVIELEITKGRDALERQLATAVAGIQ